MFIGKIYPADWVTGLAFIFGFTAVLLALNNQIQTAVVAVLVAMLADAIDGIIARRSSLKNPSGPVLDSLVDMITYWVGPVVIWIQSGFNHPMLYVGYGLIGLASIFRLSVFTITGFSQAPNSASLGRPVYRGLPVFWTGFLTVGIYWLSLFSQSIAGLALALILPVIAGLMVWDRPRYKPTHLPGIIALIIVLIGITMGLTHLRNRHTANERISCETKLESTTP